MSESSVSEASVQSPRRVLLGVAGLVVLYVAAVALLVFPAMFLGLGIQAMGARLGLWIGEPTSNDGEETWGTAIGAIAFLMVLTGAACAAWPLARWSGLRPWRTVGIASGVVVAGYAVVLAGLLR